MDNPHLEAVQKAEDVHPCEPRADFGVDEARVAELAGTRQGRVSQAGFCYQAAYAVARLASMHTEKVVLGLTDVPDAIRYDWAEDLDEAVGGGKIIFTQCKRIDDIGQPKRLAPVLLNFAPKFLWTEESKRARLVFRLVCTDRRFMRSGPTRLSDSSAADSKDIVINYIRDALSIEPTGDRLNWWGEAREFGFVRLAETLWDHTEALYVDGAACGDDPAGPLLPAEREALNCWRDAGRGCPACS